MPLHCPTYVSWRLPWGLLDEGHTCLTYVPWGLLDEGHTCLTYVPWGLLTEGHTYLTYVRPLANGRSGGGFF